ncbi:MAG TPA: ribosomal protein S18-alanine N-acetyltransferase [Anaerolineae bacterium]|jgi:ribosomal-protein-alanine N-acetyltransferase
MIDYSRLTYHVEPMTSQDLDSVMEIEHEAFSAPWSTRAYEYELHYNEMAHYYVARPHNGKGEPIAAPIPTPSSWWQRLLRRDRELTPPPVAASPGIVGYGGFWLMVDEAHISTIAAHRAWRRRGIGELLLAALIDRAAEIDARVVTLEVRVSNLNAQALYRKYGFEVTGKRIRYYSDNGEDALIMSTSSITTAEYQRRLQELQSPLYARLSR